MAVVNPWIKHLLAEMTSSQVVGTAALGILEDLGLQGVRELSGPFGRCLGLLVVLNRCRVQNCLLQIE